MLSINLIAVSVAGVSAFVLGFLFHGPLLGKVWMKLADIHPTGNEKLSEMIPQMAWNLLVNFVTALVMALVFALVFSSPTIGQATWLSGALLGALFWLGFLVTSSAIEVIWMGRKVSLWLFEAGCSLVVMMTMGAIIASW